MKKARNKATYILGINCAYHESSVALLRAEGEQLELAAFVEEERFNRIKHAKPAALDNSDELPVNALNWALAHAGIGMKDIAHIATSLNPEKRRRENVLHQHPYELPKDYFCTPAGEQLFYEITLRIEDKVRELGFAGQFHFTGHHVCHSGSSYYASGFEDAVSVVVDGVSEFESLSIFDCEGNRQKLLYTMDYPHSMGFLWEKISEFVGFSVYDSGKTMGMSAYGSPLTLAEAFSKVAWLDDDLFRMDDRILEFRSERRNKLHEALGVPFSEQPIKELNYDTLIYFDLAATLQDFTEKVMLRVIEKAKAMTGKTRLCLSGGVALNCVANQKILQAGLFDEIYIPPASNDAGTALGAALHVAAEYAPAAQRKFKLISPYSPVAFQPEDYRAVLEHADGVEFQASDDVYAESARIIADGGIIAWFQQGMEVGPRALGHRSIIADPRNPETLNKINQHVKLREIFRPLAPAVLKEKAQDWFEIEDRWAERDNSPYLYMLATAQVKKDKKRLIPSVVHYDNTARVQIVDKALSPAFYRLIEAFEKITGVPVLTNTSFNIQEPIVCTPQDAVNTFLRSNMAALVMGDYIVRRKQAQAAKPVSAAGAFSDNGGNGTDNGRPKQTLFLVEQTPKGGYTISKDIPVGDWRNLPGLLSTNRKTEGFCLPIVTDAFEYQGKDQIIPLQAEQIMFMDHLGPETARNRSFLEIGLGSGVLSLFTLLQGAKRGVGLDINPRAKVFTGFNAMANGLEGRLEIRDGDVEDIFGPVAGEKFDLVLSNPPFEPTPPDMDYYYNSVAGIYGLDFVDALLKSVDAHLTDDGVFQMVTMAPGGERQPDMLLGLAEKYLPGGSIEVILDHRPIRYDDFVSRFTDIFQESEAKVGQMKRQAREDGVTHLHMLIFRYEKGKAGGIRVSRSQKAYENWSSPLGKAVSIAGLMS